MSNIIKSFRVVETSAIYKEEPKTNIEIEKVSIEEAKQKYEEILLNAEKEAKKIIDLAYNESEKKLNQSYNRAKDIFEDAKNEGYKKGYELGKNSGYDEGYKVGYNEGKEESNKLISEALEIKNHYIDKRNNLLKDVEKDLIELVILIYEKVLNKKVNEDKELIVDLVLNGIDNLEISEKLTILVSQEDYHGVQKHKDKILAKASLIDDLDIRINTDMKKGDCILETSKGSVDVSVEKQLDEVEYLLKTILNNE